MNKELQKLIQFSNIIGKDVSLIQGGGGNTSVKDGNYMYIKASGTALKDMSEKRGYAFIDLNTYKVLEGERPSMEWLMHTYLPKYVIHSHSIYVNIYSCMYEGKEILLNLFQKYNPIYITYACPGQKLATAIKEMLNKKKSQVIFLENHGLITCADDSGQALRLTVEINNSIKKFLQKKISNFVPFAENYLKDVQKPKKCVFPDAAVFLNVEKITQSHQEIFAANDYILKIIEQLQGESRLLTKDQIFELQNLEEEQYRINKTE